MDFEQWRAGFSAAVMVPDPAGLGESLTVEQALPYRIGRSFLLAAGGALSGALAIGVAAAIILLLPYIFANSLLSLIQVCVLLAGLFAAVISFSGIFVSFAELGHKVSLEIADNELRFAGPNGEAGIGLADVREIRASQPLTGRISGYGTIEIFAYGSPAAAMIIPGVRNPQALKERLEAMLQHPMETSSGVP